MGYVTQIFLLFTNNNSCKKEKSRFENIRTGLLFKDLKFTPTSLPDFPKTVLRFVKTERL